LVGQRQQTTNITTEYAAADPIYQAKTAVSDDMLRRLKGKLGL